MHQKYKKLKEKEDKNVNNLKEKSQRKASYTVYIAIALLAIIMGTISYVSLGYTNISSIYQYILTFIVAVFLPSLGILAPIIGFDYLSFVNESKKQLESYYFKKECKKYEFTSFTDEEN